MVSEIESGVEVHLIGFGDNRPACFGQNNRFWWQVTRPVTPRQLLKRIGFPVPDGLILMKDNTVVSEDQWNEPLVKNGDQITLMSAIEGG